MYHINSNTFTLRIIKTMKVFYDNANVVRNFEPYIQFLSPKFDTGFLTNNRSVSKLNTIVVVLDSWHFALFGILDSFTNNYPLLLFYTPLSNSVTRKSTNELKFTLAVMYLLDIPR